MCNMCVKCDNSYYGMHDRVRTCIVGFKGRCPTVRRHAYDKWRKAEGTIPRLVKVRYA